MEPRISLFLRISENLDHLFMEEPLHSTQSLTGEQDCVQNEETLTLITTPNSSYEVLVHNQFRCDLNWIRARLIHN